MIKRELAKDPKLAEENWERFLPKFRRRREKKKGSAGGENGGGYDAGPSGSNAVPVDGDASAVDGQPPSKKKKKEKEKKVYTPFPPAQQPSKVSSLPDVHWLSIIRLTRSLLTRSIFNSNLENTSSNRERSNNGRKRRERQR